MRMADVPVALLAGGLATRLRPITATIPKAMVEVNGRPFIDHQLRLLHRNGIRRVVVCIGHLGEQVEEHVGSGARYDMDVQCVHDGPRLLGTGGALRRALPHLSDVNWVLYGDSYLDFDYAGALDGFERKNVLGLMTVLRNDDQWDKSNVVFRNGELIRYSKTSRCPEMTYVDYGAALLHRRAIERLPLDEPSDLATLYTVLVERGEMAGFEVKHRFYEIGSPQGLAETEAYLKNKHAA